MRMASTVSLPPFLSICIPTYNRAEYLNQLLCSLHALYECAVKMDCDFEICISDNNSTDSTRSVCRVWIEKFSRVGAAVRFRCSSSNLGADRNYLAAAAMAKGRYIWFMGSDDAVEKASACMLLNHLMENKPELIIAPRYNCSSALEVRHVQAWGDYAHREYLFGSQFGLYLRESSRLGALCSYLSSIIVARSVWELGDFGNEHLGSLYVHVEKIFSGLEQESRILIPSFPSVLSRGDNDAFEKNDLLERVGIDFKYYFRSSCVLMGLTNYNEEIPRIMRNEWPLLELIKRWSTSRNDQLKLELFEDIRSIYGIKAYILRLKPIFAILRMARKALRTARRC